MLYLVNLDYLLLNLQLPSLSLCLCHTHSPPKIRLLVGDHRHKTQSRDEEKKQRELPDNQDEETSGKLNPSPLNYQHVDPKA